MKPAEAGKVPGSTPSSLSVCTAWAEHYTRLGFALVPIPYGSKAPKGNGWQRNTITTPERTVRHFKNCLNIGLEHGTSQTGTFDIDHYEDTRLALACVGLDLLKLLEYPTAKIRGKNAVKPLYDLTELELPYFKLTWPHPTERLKNGCPKHYTVFELRAGAGKQDLLPPSLHPDGMLYTWEPHPPRSRADLLPPPPALLALWRDPERLASLALACPWREVPELPHPASRPVRRLEPSESVIYAFNAKYTLHDLLTRFGYEFKGYGRYLPPESQTGAAGAVVYQKDGLEYVVVHNASSPLCKVDANGKTRGVSAFGVWLEYEHGGDVSAAVKAAAQELSIAHGPENSHSTAPKLYRHNVYARLRSWR